MANKRVWACLALAATWLIIATEWLERDGVFRALFPASTPMERCVAAEVRRQLCHDRHWQEHWSVDCDLCFPSMLKPPSPAQHERACRADVIEADCVAELAGWESMQQAQRLGPLLVALAFYGGGLFLLSLPFLGWKAACWFRRRRVVRADDTTVA
ncbi:hypothetical protein [Dongia sedimenti]|uniref:Transmembrane protein n=1 Tax=Dongia sedimenti TaxID=3064282 RepID=A0ABU0YMY6_9PROT|nr:hypothetical protein [Rhodospirillaceae bacterium R-7]